ncbi:hypothetical protein EDC18_103317 [Natranaerovirga pectinivora]|uniref:Uncharacterized protein n=1 Tax=Natranaerovirga pectinivora TaxID=682400 RepID=A0A4R3MPR0_9FIRM|nr:hypothetical protein [Natranaerovirga pectinivora]TCT15609.1 hypothetical protein EDC18_103317 [Natranaerovirga pectinivora]
MKNKIILVFIAVLIFTFTACTIDSEEKDNAENKIEQNQPIDSQVKVDNSATKIEGRRKEFLDLLTIYK